MIGTGWPVADEVGGIGWCAGVGEGGGAVGFGGEPVTVAADDGAVGVPVEGDGVSVSDCRACT